MKNFLIITLLLSHGIVWAEKTRDFTVRGVVRETRPAKSQLVVKHEEIPGYMDAMTMPFHVRDPKILASVKAGDAITFQLHVTDKDHWIDGLKIIGVGEKEAPRPKVTDIAPFKPGDPLPPSPLPTKAASPSGLSITAARRLRLPSSTPAVPCLTSARSFPRNSEPCRRPCSPTRRHRKTGSFCR